jgi:hypothetical protein
MPKKKPVKQPEAPKVEPEISHDFDKLTVKHTLTHYFGGNKEKMIAYCIKRNEADALRRIQYMTDKEIGREEDRTFQANIAELEENREENAEARENDEWANESFVHALYSFLVEEDRISSLVRDVYDMKDEGTYFVDNLYHYAVWGMEWLICLEDDVDEIGQEFVQNDLDNEGVQYFNKDFVERFIDGEEVAEDMDIDDDVRQCPECYLSESDRSLSEDQQIEIASKRDEIEKLEEEQADCDVDTPEGEQRYEELQSQINDLEYEIEEIEENPEGEWDDDKIEQAIEDKKNEIENDPLDYLKSMGITDYSKYIDEKALVKAAVEEDGAAHFMSTYDGKQCNYTYNGTNYSIFRRS